MTSDMELVVSADGVARCIYDEGIDLHEIGKLQITRASHVEPDRDGFWWADMGPVDGPVLGPFRSRTEALGAEREWLVASSAEQCTPKETSLLATPHSRRIHSLFRPIQVANQLWRATFLAQS
jgi:hypothetical protein